MLLCASLSWLALTLSYRASWLDRSIKYFAENDDCHIWFHQFSLSLSLGINGYQVTMIGHRYCQLIYTFIITIHTAFSSPQEYQGKVDDFHLAFNAPFGSFDAAARTKDPTNATPKVTLDQSMQKKNNKIKGGSDLTDPAASKLSILVGMESQCHACRLGSSGDGRREFGNSTELCNRFNWRAQLF